MATTVTDKLLNGGLWLTTARVLINLAQAVVTIIVAWMLAPSDFGLVAIAMTVLAILNSITEMQLGQALIRHDARQEEEIDAVWSLGALRGLVLAALLVAGAWPVAAMFGDQRLAGIMAALAVFPILAGLQNPRRFIRQRELNFTQEFLITVGQKAAGVVCVLVIAYLTQSYWALIIGTIIEQAAGVVLSYVLIRHRPRPTFSGLRGIWGFSLWLTLGQIVNTLNWRIEFLLIGKFLGNSQLGIYQMGNNLAQLPTRELMTPVMQVVFPGFTNVLNNPEAADDPERLRSAYQRAQALVTAVALPVGVGVALVADPLITVVLDPRWHECIFILQYLSAVFAFQTITSIVQPLAMAKNQTRILFIRDAQMFGIRLPLILFSLYMWGLPGVVLARVVTGSISIGVNALLVRRLIDLPLRRQLAANIRSVLSVSVMACGVWGLSLLFPDVSDRTTLVVQLVAEIAAGIVLYLCASALFWILSNRPAGPETEMLRMAGVALSRIGFSGAAVPSGPIENPNRGIQE